MQAFDCRSSSNTVVSILINPGLDKVFFKWANVVLCQQILLLRICRYEGSPFFFVFLRCLGLNHHRELASRDLNLGSLWYSWRGYDRVAYVTPVLHTLLVLQTASPLPVHGPRYLRHNRPDAKSSWHDGGLSAEYARYRGAVEYLQGPGIGNTSNIWA